MGTRITLGRKTPATKLDMLKNDEDVWTIATELQPFLADEDLIRITPDDIVEVLSRHHKEVIQTASVWYEYVWDPDHEIWTIVCHHHTTIAVRDDPPHDEPILVTVDISANYA